jgi:hypothetical protein
MCHGQETQQGDDFTRRVNVVGLGEQDCRQAARSMPALPCRNAAEVGIYPVRPIGRAYPPSLLPGLYKTAAGNFRSWPRGLSLREKAAKLSFNSRP